MNELTNLLPEVIKISHEAGSVVLNYYHKNYQISKKKDHTPVTDADIVAHKIIVERLTNLTPNIPILSEEDADIDFAIRKNWQTYWLCDPLDGTLEFIKKNDEFSVNIALIHQSRPILGVVYAPCKNLCYFASKNNGAWKQKFNQKAIAITTRKIKHKVLFVVGTSSYDSTSMQYFVKKIPDYEILMLGSSLKSCLVAEGRADIYPRFGPTSEWDTAATQCILTEAGGQIVDLASKPLRYNQSKSLLNPFFIAIGDTSFNWQELIPPKLIEQDAS